MFFVKIKRKYFYSKNFQNSKIKILIDVDKNQDLYKILNFLKEKENFEILIFDNYKKLLKADFLYFQNSQPGKINFEKNLCISNLMNYIEEIHKMTLKEFLSNLKKIYLPISFDLKEKTNCLKFLNYIKKKDLKKEEINFLFKDKILHKGK